MYEFIQIPVSVIHMGDFFKGESVYRITLNKSHRIVLQLSYYTDFPLSCQLMKNRLSYSI